MTKYIAILRGINVSGSKMIKMDNLKSSMSELKFNTIETYIQSGNIVFEYQETNEDLLANIITDKIQSDFGFDVPVIVMGAGDLNAVIENNPFVKNRNEAIDKLYVTFLSEDPDSILLKGLAVIDISMDEFFISGNVIYLFCPNGYGRTKLNNNFFENKLEISATTRNWKTVIALAGMINSTK
jgi:uncharacterized protein (DUF1697 family)